MALKFYECTVKDVCDAYGVEEKRFNELCQDFEDWRNSQPHLPKDMKRKRMENIIASCKLSLERAKQRLDMYYTIRSLVPELHQDRDPRSPNICRTREVVNAVCLPKLTPENYCVGFISFLSDDPSNFDPWDMARFGFMVEEIRSSEIRNLGIVVIFDFANLQLGHVKKFTPTYMKKLAVYATEGMGMRLRGIHYVNAPSIANSVRLLMKPVLKPKIYERIHIHRAGNIETLYDFVPKSILPKDFGGDEVSMAELQQMWHQKLEEWRDWFVDQKSVLVNEHLRPGPAPSADEIFGYHGSFRKLDVD